MTIGYPPPSGCDALDRQDGKHIIDTGMPLTLQGPSWPVCLMDIKPGRFHPSLLWFDYAKPYISKVVPLSAWSINPSSLPLGTIPLFARKVHTKLSQNVYLHSYFQVSCPVCCRLDSIQPQQQVSRAVSHRVWHL